MCYSCYMGNACHIGNSCYIVTWVCLATWACHYTLFIGVLYLFIGTIYTRAFFLKKAGDDNAVGLSKRSLQPPCCVLHLHRSVIGSSVYPHALLLMLFLTLLPRTEHCRSLSCSQDCRNCSHQEASYSHPHISPPNSAAFQNLLHNKYFHINN